ncbi:MAG: transcriptional regulator [Nitrososphaeria archaeon]
MTRDQLIGVALLLGSIFGIVIYGWLLFFWDPRLILQLTIFLMIAGVLGVIGWIGYTLATTPPPQPIEELTKEGALTEGKESEKPEEKSQ